MKSATKLSNATSIDVQARSRKHSTGPRERNHGIWTLEFQDHPGPRRDQLMAFEPIIILHRDAHSYIKHPGSSKSGIYRTGCCPHIGGTMLRSAERILYLRWPVHKSINSHHRSREDLGKKKMSACDRFTVQSTIISSLLLEGILAV